jgi:hypothetical protein
MGMGGFIVKLMKLKIQEPAFAQAPTKALGGALAMYIHGDIFL